MLKLSVFKRHKIFVAVIVAMAVGSLMVGAVLAADPENEVQKLTASDGVEGAGFGESVPIAVDTAVICARFEDGGAGATAYVFVRDGEVWDQQARLTSSDGEEGDEFGHSVAVIRDRAVIGAPRVRSETGAETGAAYVFVRDGENWNEQAKLVASDGADEDFFGDSVALSGDTAVIGATFDDDDGESSGSAYVFGLTT